MSKIPPNIKNNPGQEHNIKKLVNFDPLSGFLNQTIESDRKTSGIVSVDLTLRVEKSTGQIQTLGFKLTEIENKDYVYITVTMFIDINTFTLVTLHPNKNTIHLKDKAPMFRKSLDLARDRINKAT